MKLRLLFIVVFSMLIWQQHCAAQVVQNSFSIKQFTDEDGLPQNSVKAIAADSLGFIWMVTENGLVRFDGSNFAVFNKQNIRYLKSNRFSDIRIGLDKNIYAITDRQEYIKIKNGKVSNEPPFDKARFDLDSLSYKCGAHRGATWLIGLPNRPIYKRNPPSPYLIPADSDAFIELHHDRVIFLDRVHPKKEQLFSNKDVLRFFLLQNQLYYKNEDGTFTRVSKNRVTSSILSGDICLDPGFRKNKPDITIFWTTTSKTVLFYYNRSFYTVNTSGDGQLQTKLIASGFDINNKEIINYYYDSKYNRLFLGSSINGLYIINKKQFRVFTEKGNKKASVYYAQVPYDSNYILTSQGSIMGIAPAQKKFFYTKKQKFSSPYSLLCDHSGFIWNQHLEDLVRYDHNCNKVASWILPKEISTLYESADSILWIGLKGEGFYCMDISEVSPKLQYFNGLDNITYIISESADKLWVGTVKGLYLVNKATHQSEEIIGLQGKYIRSLYAKSPDELWITTYEDGLFLYTKGKLITLPRDKDNFLSTPHCIVEDDSGFFWLPTNKGLFQAARADLLAFARNEQKDVFYYFYGKEYGFNTNEFNGGCEPCGLKLKSGQISLPSLDGMVWFNPGTLKIELPNNPLVIDRVEVDRREIKCADTILLPHKFDQVKLLVNTVYFGDKKNVQIFYAITKGNQPSKSWYPLGSDHFISFSSLSSGKYQLCIRKLNGFGKDNIAEITKTIIVPYAYYETYWFKLLVILLLIVLIYVYVRLRILYIVRKNRLLELRIARRTRKLTHTLRALELSENSLRRQTQIQEMLLAAISHDVKSPMKYLLLVSQKMQQFILKEDYESLTTFNQGIHDTVSRIYGILDNLLKYVSVQIKKGAVKFEIIHLAELTNDKIATFSQIAQTNFTEIHNSVPENIFVKSSPELLSIIIHNLIDNSVKYTANGNIIISAAQLPGRVQLIIEDTGTGIAPELAKWLNNETNNKIEIDTAAGHKGMGLIIVKELLVLLNSKIIAEQTHRGGTRITILLTDLV